jgi:membrane protease YdiL (CAAX protease family)
LDLQNLSGLKEILTEAGTEDSAFKSLPPFAGALYFVWLWFSGNLLSVLGEECAWRGFVLNRLMPLGQKKAVLISGVLWGLWMQPIVVLGRAYFPSQPILGGLIMMMTAILIGVVFGWLRLASGSIWPSVCAHSANAAAYHACGLFGAAEQTNRWPGTMIVGVLIPLILLITFLILTKRFPVEDRSLQRVPA